MLNYHQESGHLISRLDPRAKIILFIALVIVFFSPVHLLHLTALTVFVCLVSALSFGIRRGLKPFHSLAVLFIMILLLQPFFIRNGRVLLSLFNNFIVITDAGLEMTLRIVLRLAGVSLLCYIYFVSTELNQFLLTLRFFRFPFQAALMISTAIRYIPLLGTAYHQIRDSRKLLGLSTKKVFPALSGLTVYAVKQIPVLAANLECKGVFRKNPRSSYFLLPGRRKLALDMLFSLCIIGINIVPYLLR
ncbi:MAG: energy-coupling factor transporter transmembrane protein EcfT [Spirochaetales bacterium]|nr:energy-coupling factor transporter transmembrane protein EcfT [Spirochaetales bacterium]